MLLRVWETFVDKVLFNEYYKTLNKIRLRDGSTFVDKVIQDAQAAHRGNIGRQSCNTRRHLGLIRNIRRQIILCNT